MISITFTVACLAVLAISTMAHLLLGPRSDHPVNGIWAYIIGVVPVLVAFGFVMMIDDPAPANAVATLVVLFIAAAIPPIMGRVWMDYQELQDYRTFREEAKRAKKNSI